MCASEKQRDFWLGSLASAGRLNPRVYDEDESLRSLIDVVPFGLSDDDPVRTGPGIRGVVPGIAATDKVILWGGGIYNWFDPATLIRAVDLVRTKVPEVRLYFMGMRHPNPDVPEMRIAVEAVALAAELGLTGRHVFFNDDWVPYADRQNYLLDADIGVSTHFTHVETAYSFRTRVLDYFWAGLPVVCTEGDALSLVVHEREVGLTVPPEDPEALADALHRLLTDDELNASCRRNLTAVRADFSWKRALDPLLAFCRRAVRSPDQRDRRVARPSRAPSMLKAPVSAPPWRWHGLRHDLGVARAMVEQGGLRQLGRQLGVRARRLVRGST
jgi:glycosyltransferase involved in cell wall biosynthesis